MFESGLRVWILHHVKICEKETTLPQHTHAYSEVNTAVWPLIHLDSKTRGVLKKCEEDVK